MKSEFEYGCSVCDKWFTRKKSAVDHAVDKIATHPLGGGTPILKRAKAPVAKVDADAAELLQDLVATVGALASRLSAPPEFAALGRRLVTALEPARPGADPACTFALEQLPPRHELKWRLLDIFTYGVVPHLVWTHVHRHGTVRASEREEHLQVFGAHGWTTVPAAEVARVSLDRMQTRLEKMWTALCRDDPKAASVLRPAMARFAAAGRVFMDGEVFDMDSDVTPADEAVATVARELSLSLTEHSKLS